MSIREIVELCIIAVAVTAVLLYTVVAGIKNKWFSKLWNTIKDAIKEAEDKYPERGSGSKKKEYVLQKVEEKCKEFGIPYALLKRLINIAIDKVIEDYNIISK
jgi:hypothetical protein